MTFRRARRKKIRRNPIKPECGADSRGNGAKVATKGRGNPIKPKCGAASGESGTGRHQRGRKCDKTQAWARLEGQPTMKVYISGPCHQAWDASDI